jgi:hypothetical protein
MNIPGYLIKAAVRKREEDRESGQALGYGLAGAGAVATPLALHAMGFTRGRSADELARALELSREGGTKNRADLIANYISGASGLSQKRILGIYPLGEVMATGFDAGDQLRGRPLDSDIAKARRGHYRDFARGYPDAFERSVMESTQQEAERMARSEWRKGRAAKWEDMAIPAAEKIKAIDVLDEYKYHVGAGKTPSEAAKLTALKHPQWARAMTPIVRDSAGKYGRMLMRARPWALGGTLASAGALGAGLGLLYHNRRKEQERG